MFIAFGRGISFVLWTREISLRKNNSHGSPQSDHSLTCSYYNIYLILHHQRGDLGYVWSPHLHLGLLLFNLLISHFLSLFLSILFFFISLTECTKSLKIENYMLFYDNYNFDSCSKFSSFYPKSLCKICSPADDGNWEGMDVLTWFSKHHAAV